MSLSEQTLTRLNWAFGAIALSGLVMLLIGPKGGAAIFVAALIGVAATVFVTKVRVLKIELPKWLGGKHG